MSVRDSYNTTVSAAEQTKAATIQTAQTTFQETINASGCNSGYTLQSGSYSTFAAALKTANAALAASKYAAEVARQASVALGRDILRNAGTDAGAF